MKRKTFPFGVSWGLLKSCGCHVTLPPFTLYLSTFLSVHHGESVLLGCVPPSPSITLIMHYQSYHSWQVSSNEAIYFNFILFSCLLTPWVCRFIFWMVWPNPWDMHSDLRGYLGAINAVGHVAHFQWSFARTEASLRLSCHSLYIYAAAYSHFHFPQQIFRAKALPSTYFSTTSSSLLWVTFYLEQPSATPCPLPQRIIQLVSTRCFILFFFFFKCCALVT